MESTAIAASAGFDRATVWRARLGVFAVFLVTGIGVGLWAVHIPIVTTRLQLDPAVLGLALLTIGIGAVVSMPIVSIAAALTGTRHLAIAGGLLFAVTLPLPIIAPNVMFLFVGCALLGLAMGCVDVTINAHGTEVEAAHGRPTMSAFHGFFSLGGLAGSGLGALVIAMGLGDGAGAVGVAVLLVALVVWASFNLLPTASSTVGVRLVWPTRAVIGIGILCGLSFGLEGIVTDWSTLFLFQEKAAGPVAASAGVGLFMATMALFRFLGDGIKLRYGGRRIVVVSGICVATGTALAILAPWAWLGAVGFGLIGVGAANVVPVLFSASAGVPGVPAAIGIASVTSFGYAGHLLAPPLIGFMARSYGLPIALSVVGVAGIIIAAGGLRLRK
jgi:MFS family permease